MSDSTFTYLLAIAAGIYFIATMVALGRMLAGPNSLDRLVSLDSVVAMLQGMLAAYMAWSLDTSAVYPMLVVALLGFISSLSVAKFRVPDGKLKLEDKSDKSDKSGRADKTNTAKEGSDRR